MEHLPWHAFERLRSDPTISHPDVIKVRDQYRGAWRRTESTAVTRKGVPNERAQPSRPGIDNDPNAESSGTWRIHADFAQRLMPWPARRLGTTTTIATRYRHHGLCAGLLDHRSLPDPVPVGPFPQNQVGGEAAYPARPARPVPAFIHISDGKLHDVNVIDLLLPEAGAFYVMDRAYLDFARLYSLHRARSFFLDQPRRPPAASTIRRKAAGPTTSWRIWPGPTRNRTCTAGSRNATKSTFTG